MKKTARKILRFLSADLKLKGRSRLVRKLGPYLQEDNPIRTRMSDGSYMSLDLTEQWSSAMYYGLYDVVERDLIITLLQRGDTFFDLGAHVGYYTIAAAKKVAETGAVHAFEPNSRNANVLEQNVKLNAFENVRINRVAVSDARGHARLAVPDMASYGPGVSAWATIMDYFPGAICEPVETISIDEYIEYAHIQCINLIKMDIEAAEVLALRGMCRVFGGQTPPRILSEVNSKRLKESGYDTGIIHSILSKFGYTGYRVVGQGLEKADAPSVDRVVENSLFFPPADPCLAILGETVSLRSLINLMRSGRKQERVEGNKMRVAISAEPIRSAAGLGHFLQSGLNWLAKHNPTWEFHAVVGHDFARHCQDLLKNKILAFTSRMARFYQLGSNHPNRTNPASSLSERRLLKLEDSHIYGLIKGDAQYAAIWLS